MLPNHTILRSMDFPEYGNYSFKFVSALARDNGCLPIVFHAERANMKWQQKQMHEQNHK